MADKSGTRASDVFAPLPIDAMMEFQRPALTAMAELNGRLFESIAAVNKEWASFVDRRLKEDLAVTRQLADCRNVQDLYQVYAQFLQTACSQYQSNLESMSKIGSSLAENALQTMQSRADEPS